VAVIVVKLVVIEPWKALVNLPRFFFGNHAERDYATLSTVYLFKKQPNYKAALILRKEVNRWREEK